MIRFFSTAATLIITVYFSHTLIPGDYGTYQNFWIRLLVLSTLACAGLAVLAYTYAPATISHILRQIRLQHYLLYLFFLVVIALVFVLLSPHRPLSVQSLAGAVITLLFFVSYVLNILTEALLTVYRKFTYLIISGILYALVFVLLHRAVAGNNFDLYTLVGYLTILTTAKLCCNLFLSVKAVRTTDTREAPAIHMKRIKAMWLHTFFYDTTQVVFRYLDKFIVSYLVAAEYAAIYVNGTIDIPFLPLALTAVSSAALMQLNKNRNNSRETAVDTIRKSSSILATVTFPVFFFLLFFREEFIVFVFSGKYFASIPVFACALTRLPFYILNVPFYLQYRQKGDLINKGALLDMVLTLLLIYPMYRWLGLQGIVLSFIISSYIQLLYYARCVSRLLHTPLTRFLPVKSWIIKLVIFGGAAFLSHFLLSGLLPSVPRLIAGGVLLIGTGGLWLLLEYKRSGLVTFAPENQN